MPFASDDSALRLSEAFVVVGGTVALVDVDADAEDGTLCEGVASTGVRRRLTGGVFDLDLDLPRGVAAAPTGC